MTSLLRFYNFLIDSIVVGVIVMLLSYLFKNLVMQEQMRMIGITLYYIYYLVMEYFLGKTVGKILTKTKVVGVKNKKKPNFAKILIRTLSRLIPIDVISYLFNNQGIHDYLSKTQLIKIKS